MKKLASLIFMIASSCAVAAEYPFSVPTDSSANYTVLEKDVNNDFVTIITKREGKSGVTYSKRMYSCKDNTFKYLGSGETLEQMSSSQPDDHMSPIIAESITDYVGKEACR
ncbi:hypothetical protein QMS96_19880 [Cronobacter sakazakii]|nr:MULTISPECIES: hypothetical protein [Cronobacter]MDK1224903.1 hypothetical protein [Cronobacter turicensis]MDI7491674.1 hypothetical protein [Cronobacter dublinensis]MDI7514784.1 hypothetical protein [Cronobacter sakazakii]MDI7522411.1 hypothetical protein [Cronobacter sakazakii]MDI7527963.1 hypothetical protein [Cronobacter sakazakii]